MSGCAPRVGVYDDGCHLIEYLHNHIGRDLVATAAVQRLAEIKFSVDRMHFKNHVGVWCRTHMDPNKNNGELKNCVGITRDFIRVFLYRFEKRQHRGRRTIVQLVEKLFIDNQ